jgi:CSLREA domain-containing protein
LVFAAGLAPSAPVRGKTQALAFGTAFLVNSTGDQGEATPDNQCETVIGNGVCTLRAAIELVNARNNGGDGIFFSIPGSDPGCSGGVCTITLASALPDLSVPVTISGPGAGKLIVLNNISGLRIFNVTTSGTVSFSNLTMSGGNIGANGGGIQNASTGTVNVTNCTLSSNSADNGGGISNSSSGTVNVTNSTLSGNSASGPSQIPAGGGIFNFSGTVTVTNSTLINNQALRTSGDQSFGDGGGIFNNVDGKLNVIRSTFSNNSANVAPGIVVATGGGGGIFNSSGSFGNSGTMNITNSTFSGNSSNSGGGAIFTNGAFGGPRVNITNSTISGNTGGGIYKGDSDVFVKSTIIANNSTDDVSGSFTSQGFNLIGKNDGAAASFPAGNPNGNNDIVGTSASPVKPKLGPLQNNGGPTYTMALLSGSPAIDKGTSNGLTGTLTTDQRGVGYVRTINESIANATGGDGTDIGAFELGAHISAVSRKTHGTAGSFNINLPLTGTKVGVECRKGGSSHVFTVILTFPTAVTVGSVSVTPDPKAPGATASVSSSGVGGHLVTVNLTGVSNAQRIAITLSAVSDGTNTNDVIVPMGVLLGDTDNNGSVTSNDVTLTESKVGQTVNGTDFREDVTLDGLINSTDVNLVQSKVGTKLP